MGRIRQCRDPKLSLWQSAVDEVVAKRKAAAVAQALGGPPVIRRPDTDDSMVHAVTAHCAAAESGIPVPSAPPAGRVVTEGLADVALYCSNVALQLAEALGKALLGRNPAEIARRRAQLGQFTDCDPRYAEAVEKYTEYFVLQQREIPYIRHMNLGDFVITNNLPANATVALVADWGTGQDVAKNVLAQIARKDPDVVIHLGDVYYAGTQFEVENYFLRPWRDILRLTPGAPRPATYTLSGNHDMYSGGEAYYGLIGTLGQPASYFCLRNDDWQFLAIDTGLHDCKPGGGLTFLEAREIEWLTDKINNSGGRKNILISHHQLFSAYDPLNGNGLNNRLYAQVQPLLDKVLVWFWGHEHNLVIHERYNGVLARCIGYGAFPVGINELPTHPPIADVPVANVQLDKGFAFYNHGYVIIKLSGSAANVSYYQDSDESKALWSERFT
jgi:predicted phosphodiesterase